MKQKNIKKLLLLNLPYFLLGLYATKLGQAYRLAAGAIYFLETPSRCYRTAQSDLLTQ